MGVRSVAVAIAALMLVLSPLAYAQAPTTTSDGDAAQHPGYYFTKEYCDEWQDADGTWQKDCQSEVWYCPESPEDQGTDSSNWTHEERAAWEDANCYALAAECLVPHEAQADWANWAYAEQRQWFIDNCETEHCPAPPEGETGWTEAKWFEWYYYECAAAPCGDLPTDFHGWNEEQRDDWFAQNCPWMAPMHHCPPPEEFGEDPANWTEEDRRAFEEAHCPPPAFCPPPDDGNTGDDGAADGVHPPGPCIPCPMPPQDFRNWTSADRADWIVENCHPCPTPPQEFHSMTEDQQRWWVFRHCVPPGCHPPPEFENWTDAERRQWVNDACGEDCPPLPDDTSGWGKEDWHRYFQSCHGDDGPCPPSEHFAHWSDAERRQYVQDTCASPPCPDLPEDTSTWQREDWDRFFADCHGCAEWPADWNDYTEDERRAWFDDNCGPEATDDGDGGGDDGGSGDDGDDTGAGDGDDAGEGDGTGGENNQTLGDQAKDLVDNASGDQIVVPGPSPVLLLAGLGLVGLLMGRRRG